MKSKFEELETDSKIKHFSYLYRDINDLTNGY